MSLADGEYEINLDELLNISTIAPINESENIAIRYGFVPDSMDQSKPLRLYQNDQECLLKASSNEGPGKPIIFEGLTQKHRGNDSFYLTYNPGESDSVMLKRLNSTIRFSKSRNASKLQSKLDQWEKDAKSARNREEKRISRKKEASPAVQPSPATPNYSSRSALAAKRPPTANNTPEPKQTEPIISESDFDDLNDFDFDEPRPQASKKPPVKKASKPAPAKEEANKAPKVPRTTKSQVKVPTKRTKKVKSGPIIERAIRDDSMDIDDDFKDLEDQLQEVLEEEAKSGDEQTSFNEKPSADNGIKFDSDESDFDDYQFPGIKINVEDNESKPSRDSFSETYTNSNSSQKPMSLRDLIGGGKKAQDDDMSSSEEE